MRGLRGTLLSKLMATAKIHRAVAAASTPLAALGLAGAAAAVALRRPGDPDLPWHLAVGRAVLETGSRVSRDDFSYTFTGEAVPYEYAAQLCLYGAHRLAGPLGLQLLGGLLVAGVLCLCAVRSGKERLPLGLAACALAFGALAPWLVVRPALFSFLLFPAALLCIERHRRTGELRWLALLIPLQALWANLHGFAVLGAVAAGGYAAYVWLCRATCSAETWWKPALPSAHGRRPGAVAGIAAAAACATCLSPFGAGIFTAPLRVAAHHPYVHEWAPASPGLFALYDPALGLFLLAVVAAVFAGREDDGETCPNAFDAALVGATFAMTLPAFRMAPIFVLAAVPFATRRLWPRLRGTRALPVLTLAAGLAAPWMLIARGDVSLGKGFDALRIPEKAADFIEARRPEGPVWNNIVFGGYLIWRLHPEVRVFIDGRTAHLYPLDFLRSAWKAEHYPGDFAALSAKYGFQWAVVDARWDSHFARPLAADPGWAMVYIDDLAAVYVRADGPNRALAERGYKALRHLTPWQALSRASVPLPDILNDADLALEQSPDSTRARFWSAAAALLRGDRAAARAHRDRIEELAPDHVGLRDLDRALAAPAA